jgi:hypothetical protein
VCDRPPEVFAEGAFESPIDQFRGVDSATIAGSLRVWTSDVTISVYAGGKFHTKALEAAGLLKPANSGQFPALAGIDEHDTLPAFDRGRC